MSRFPISARRSAILLDAFVAFLSARRETLKLNHCPFLPHLPPFIIHSHPFNHRYTTQAGEEKFFEFIQKMSFIIVINAVSVLHGYISLSLDSSEFCCSHCLYAFCFSFTAYRLPKRALQYRPSGKRNLGRPKKRWRAAV
jgi:hypothetical protein